MRCRLGRFSFAVCALLLTTGLSEAAVPVATASQIKSFLDITTIDVSAQYSALLSQWDADLRKALKSGGLEKASAKLHVAYSLPLDQMRDLISLWVLHNIADEQGRLYSDDDRAAHPDLWPSLRKEALALVAASGHKALVVLAASVVLTSNERCDGGDFTQLLVNAPDPVESAWLAADISDCAAWHRGFIHLVPQRSTASLVHLAQWGELDAADELAVFAWLGSEEGLARFAPLERATAQTSLAYAFVERALKLGLAEEGIATFEALPADIRKKLVTEPLTKVVLHPDGLEISLELRKTGDEFMFDLAAAYLQLQRAAEARALFAMAGSVEAAKASLRCKFDRRPDPRNRSEVCKNVEGEAKAIMLDRALNPSGADPYDIAEVYSGMAEGSIWVGVICSLFPAPYEFCEDARKGAVDNLRNGRGYVPDGRADSQAALSETGNTELARLRTSYKAAVDRAIVSFGGKGFDDHGPRQSIDPLPSRFAQLSMPEALRGAPTGDLPDLSKTLAPLPQGYMPVRLERNGARAVAITLSQNYDPSGEVSPGGYWVHLSDDGGKTWKKPLYTGLSYGFPYVILEKSKLPLIDGETLNIAAEVHLLDTASIMYPPVALQSRKHETNLYLKAPLSDLVADSDGDGLTDLAEEHLLLDPHRTDTDGDGLIDGEDPMPNVRRAPGITTEQQAIQLVLEKIFSIKTGAIIQAMDHTSEADVIASAITSAATTDPNSVDRPIFVQGDPADFAGFSPSRMMLVYSAADVEKLQRMTPDFHAMAFGKVVFNRTRTRGYFSWSLGWTGGTVRLIREGDRWKLEEMRSWIT